MHGLNLQSILLSHRPSPISSSCKDTVKVNSPVFAIPIPKDPSIDKHRLRKAITRRCVQSARQGISKHAIDMYKVLHVVPSSRKHAWGESCNGRSTHVRQPWQIMHACMHGVHGVIGIWERGVHAYHYHAPGYERGHYAVGCTY